ncbi:alpha/beta hydrolase [Halocalculus aciditolerans]|uniref:Phospholipase/carboxylesterase n=1 Tax=Halocalculus aciditolerans TaxID=1383812 RepID=A0A830F8R3_9EURY|nr:dienelactone hydrolase family protein [Halocalculus aciditolerans]GGL50974.1 phospholipase/carboxylesterase [Halocalculus aciditolerans]
MSAHRGDDPHGDAQVVTTGAALDDASAAVVMAHGRGATPRSVLGLASEFDVDDVAYLAPAAAGNTWYPNPFTAPRERNEPSVSSAMNAIRRAVDRAADAVGRDSVVLLGFSQGACLASDYVARNPARYGGLVAFSGGLIGDAIDEEEYEGDLDSTPVFLGCSDRDPHIPESRVHETRDVLDALGADVTERIYEGMGHTIVQDEVEHAAEIVADARGN